jgi:hypothetical protein
MHRGACREFDDQAGMSASKCPRHTALTASARIWWAAMPVGAGIRGPLLSLLPLARSWPATPRNPTTPSNLLWIETLGQDASLLEKMVKIIKQLGAR